MDAADWAEIADEVAEALQEVGTAATLIRAGGTTGPEWAPVAGPATEHPITAMQAEWTQKEVDGDLILLTDRKLIVAAEGVEPRTDDQIRFGGETLAVKAVLPTAPGGVAVLYRVACRA